MLKKGMRYFREYGKIYEVDANIGELVAIGKELNPSYSYSWLIMAAYEYGTEPYKHEAIFNKEPIAELHFNNAGGEHMVHPCYTQQSLEYYKSVFKAGNIDFEIKTRIRP